MQMPTIKITLDEGRAGLSKSKLPAPSFLSQVLAYLLDMMHVVPVPTRDKGAVTDYVMSNQSWHSHVRPCATCTRDSHSHDELVRACTQALRACM
jgi:hypothetical protein